MSNILSETDVYQRSSYHYEHTNFSKLWYCLRLFKPTTKFINSLRTSIYQFVWQKKTPKLKKDLIFAPITSGGLQVMDPSIQQKLLQKRWISYIVEPTVHCSFVSDLMLTHLSYCDKSSFFPLLPLYDRDYRKGCVLHKDLSIWHVIFTTFDYFVSGATVKLVDIPVDTIMTRPLYKLLVNTPDSHWTKRHPTFEAHLFFIFDAHSKMTSIAY
jgi:hypothetical protein